MEIVSQYNKKGVIFKCLFTFKEQNIKYISSLPTKTNVAGHFLTGNLPLTESCLWVTISSTNIF